MERNIYKIGKELFITSNEEIKEEDWCLDEDGLKKCTAHAGAMNHYFQKIILTSDTELIKDGIQAIDDEFLEWWINNPSCEFVEVKDVKTIPCLQLTGNNHLMYKIIIPKEEAEKDMIMELEKDPILKDFDDKVSENLSILKQKQETLEEIALSFLPHSEVEHDTDFIIGFEFGAKWQTERMYNEEDMREAFENGVGSGKYQAEYGDNAKGSMNFEYFIKQFKKK